MSDEAEQGNDVETVRLAMIRAGFSPVGGALPAFERIVAELTRLREAEGVAQAEARLRELGALR